MTLTFENSLLNFFKSNMSYIQEYDFAEGTKQVNQFFESVIPQITSGLNYMAQFLFLFLLMETEEILKAAVEFWLWLSYKVFTLKELKDTLDFIINKTLLNNNILPYLLECQVYINEEGILYNISLDFDNIIQYLEINKLSDNINMQLSHLDDFSYKQ